MKRNKYTKHELAAARAAAKHAQPKTYAEVNAHIERLKQEIEAERAAHAAHHERVAIVLMVATVIIGLTAAFIGAK